MLKLDIIQKHEVERGALYHFHLRKPRLRNLSLYGMTLSGGCEVQIWSLGLSRLKVGAHFPMPQCISERNFLGNVCVTTAGLLLF